MIGLLYNFGSETVPFSAVFRQAIDERIKVVIKESIDYQMSQLEKSFILEIRERDTD